MLTFHNAMSYGAVLQAYGLEKTIEDLGFDPEIINYMCEDIYNAHVRIIPKTKNIKFNIKMMLMGRKRFIWRNKLRGFRNQYLIESNPVKAKDLEELGNKYDVVISGSDQVFNDVCTKFDPVYFLNFVNDDKKYSYAASFGFTEIPKELKNQYKERLQGFQELSVREESGCKIVKELLGKDAKCHIDPTFLLKVSDWDRIETHDDRKPYILVFNVLKPRHLLDYAVKLGEAKGLDVLYLENYAFPPRKGVKYIGPVGPDGFVGLIKNAEYVITNSFHGMAFSIIYQKKFAMELDTSGSRNIRSEGLLKKLGLINTEIIDGELDIDSIKYDWDYANHVIEEERIKARSYLKGICENNA